MHYDVYKELPANPRHHPITLDYQYLNRVSVLYCNVWYRHPESASSLVSCLLFAPLYILANGRQ